MPTRIRASYEAGHRAREQLASLGRELRVARIVSGKRQKDVARAIGASPAQVCRIEGSKAPGVSYLQLARFAGVVGLQIWMRAYPSGRRLLDGPQIAVFRRLRDRVGTPWTWETEVSVPIPGDLRAADALGSNGSCRLQVEVITRLADFQAQSRSATLKKRDLHADRLVLLIAATRANRRALAEARDIITASFPLATAEIVQAMEAGFDPGGDGIVLL